MQSVRRLAQTESAGKTPTFRWLLVGLPLNFENQTKTPTKRIKTTFSQKSPCHTEIAQIRPNSLHGE